MGLSLKRIATIRKTKQPGRYRDGGGLLLQVARGGSCSWVFRFERGGRERMMGLGPAHTIGLEQARELARQARQQLLAGLDPLEARAAERARLALEAARTISFEAAAHGYFNAHEKKWRSRKTRDQFLSSLKQYAFPKIGRLPVASIDTGLVLKVIEPIWSSKTVTANRVRGRIEAVLDWAKVRGYRNGGDNPAKWSGHLAEVLPARNQITRVEHHPAMPFTQVPEFLGQLRQREGIAARALEFTILTAARTSEVIGATRAEIDLTNRIWVVPAGRIKGGREHRVPLSDRALEILNDLPRDRTGQYLFIGYRQGTGLSSNAMSEVLRRMGHRDFTIHGFRSSFRDWAAERTHYANHVVEMALAHKIANEVEAAYRRGDLLDKRRQLMAAWGRFCEAPTTEAGEVVLLQGVR